MPAIVGGPIKFVSVGGEATVLFGDTLLISPKTASKTYSGAGGGLIGDFSVALTGVSLTNTLDPDAVDTNTLSGI